MSLLNALLSLRRAAAGALLAAGAAALPAIALAQPAPPAPAASAASAPGAPGMRHHARGMHPPGPMHPGAGAWMPMHGPGLDRMLERVKATPEQRTQIRQIHEAAAADLRREHEAARALHEQGAKLFTADTIDVAAAESLRQQMLAHHDKVTHRMLQAMIDVANVLTPEQRREMARLMAEHRPPMPPRPAR